MLTQARFTNFRTFSSLKLDGLARVNLFVGANNAGKTAVLDGLGILFAENALEALYVNARRRREWSGSRAISVAHFFHGHVAVRGRWFSLERPERTLRCEIVAQTGQDEAKSVLHLPTGGVVRTTRLALRLDDIEIPLLADRTLSTLYRPEESDASVQRRNPVEYVGIVQPSSLALSARWEGVVLTPEEPKVIEALQIVEPDVERIAFLASQKGGTDIFVKLRGSDERIPLGSMGDGMRRLLSLALHLVSARGGTLLIDEIDTGLHHSTMLGMWRLLIETARRLDVQVFATTHSLDCVRALAWLYEESPDIRDEVALHRVERGAAATTRYGVEEIATAARQHIELR